MSSITFQTTGNEARLLTTIIPVNYDITKLNWNDVKDFPKFSDYDLGTNAIIHNAIKYSNITAVDMNSFNRNLNRKDKGTADSANWPMSSTRKCIAVSDKENDTINEISRRWFQDDRTYAMIWMLYNYNRMVSQSPELLKRDVEVAERTNTLDYENSTVMSIRYPDDVVNYAKAQASAQGINPGRWMRETTIPYIRSMMGGIADTSSDDNFNFDLDAEV